MSVMSTNPSGGSGAMLYRAGADGTGCPKSTPIVEISVISTKVSLLTSAGQALRPQCKVGFVPTDASTAELNPSQSGSLRGTSQGGRLCVAFGQLGQLSTRSGRPSPSLSAPGVGDAVEVGVADAVGVAVAVDVAVSVGAAVGVAVAVGVGVAVAVPEGEGVGVAVEVCVAVAVPVAVAVAVGVAVAVAGVAVAVGVVVGVPAGVADAVGVDPLAVVKFTTSTPLLLLPRGSSQSARKNRRCWPSGRREVSIGTSCSGNSPRPSRKTVPSFMGSAWKSGSSRTE